MKAEFETYKCGDCDRWWTYRVFINGERVKPTPMMYRMYKHEKTAIRHAQNVMDGAIAKHITNLNANK